jgi:hypothetical protein
LVITKWMYDTIIKKVVHSRSRTSVRYVTVGNYFLWYVIYRSVTVTFQVTIEQVLEVPLAFVEKICRRKKQYKKYVAKVKRTWVQAKVLVSLPTL